MLSTRQRRRDEEHIPSHQHLCSVWYNTFIRGVAQLASVPALGAGGRGFESLRPDIVRKGQLDRQFLRV